MSEKPNPFNSKPDSLKLSLEHMHSKPKSARISLPITQNKVAKSPVVLFGLGNRSPLTTSSSTGLAKLLESARPINISSPQPTIQSQKQPVLQFINGKSNVSKVPTPPRTKVPTGKTSLEHIPTISLGAKRTEAPVSSRKSSTGSEKSKFKMYYSEDFWKSNEDIFTDFAMQKKNRNTSDGIFEDTFKIEIGEDNTKSFWGRNAQSFSRDTMTSLEASLEASYKFGYFLKEVSNRISRNIYPPPDILYVIMKAVLLEAEENSLAESASKVLQRVLDMHPSQAPDIKSEKLYHKAFALMTVPDIDETSVIMLTVGDWLSRSDKEDWTYWCSRDANLGTLWTFYSRVFKIAVNNLTASLRHDGVKAEPVSSQKVHNATLLTIFLTKLAWKDYQDVLSRNDYSSNSPMVKCLIADLLWPTMTGLEPWFRRPSPNLADMISLYVDSVRAYVSHLNADESDDVTSVQSDDSDADYDQVDDSCFVVKQLSHLIAITSSWCVLCDVRDKERGRRTATKSLEAELVQTLRFELEDTNFEVLEIALKHLPTRLRLKVNTSLIQEICSDALVPDSAKPDEEISLELLTSRHMQLMPIVLPGEENDSLYSDPNATEEQQTEKGSENNRDLAKAGKPMVDVKKRNRKGETPLHIACMHDRPENVRNLLKQPEVNPNARDYAGWTALGEACNRGHLECVRRLLELPVKEDTMAKNRENGDKSPLKAIDLILCPANGQTPLHDALENGHLDVACLLLEKGGVQLLDMTDSKKMTPLDYCDSDEAKSYIIEQACNIAVKERQKKIEKTQEKDDKQTLMKLAPKEDYKKVLPPMSVLESENWCGRVRWIFKLTCLLLSHYVNSGAYQLALGPISSKSHVTDSSTDDVIIVDEGLTNRNKVAVRNAVDIKRYANDVVFCLRWKECWDLYLEHIKRLLGDNEEVANVIIEETNCPISLLDSEEEIL